MTDQDYLIHYGVLGMKWGVRKDKRSKNVRKSFRTKTFERLASSSEKHAAYRRRTAGKDDASAAQWEKEAAQNRELAKKSYEYDKWNKRTSRKDKKALKKASEEYQSRTRKEWVDAWNEASEEIDRTITPKYNQKLKKAGLYGKENFDKAMKDSVKKAKYDKIIDDYNTEVGKKRTEMWLKRFGEAPTWENWDTHPANKRKK